MPSIDTNAKLTAAIIDWFEVNTNPADTEKTSGYTTYYGLISDWNITNDVTSMASAFDASKIDYVGTAAATGIPTFNKNIGAWNTAGVKNMDYMFNGAAAFNNGGQALAFNTGEVTDMNSMFNDAAKFNQSLGDNFTTSKVINMGFMFYDAAEFNQYLGDKFDTSKVIYMSYMFSGAENFNQSLGSNFNTSKVTDMGFMFSGAAKFNQSLGSKFNTSNVNDMESMFSWAAAFNQSLGDKFDTSKVTNMYGMFAEAAAFNQSVINFDTSKVTTMSEMFYGAAAFTGDGVANWKLDKKPRIVNMFTSSLVPNTDNNTSIWYAWYDDYKYTELALKGAGLEKRDRPSINTVPTTAEGVVAKTKNTAEALKAFVNNLMKQVNALVADYKKKRLGQN